MSKEEVTLYYSVASKSITAIWMLEELAVPYRLESRDIRGGANKSPEYLRLNPMGHVPTLQCGEVIVSENPAICIYLADRYSYGSLAPKIDDAARGAYLKWLVFTTAMLEPAAALKDARIEFESGRAPSWGPNWGRVDEIAKVVAEALAGRDYILGSRFTAADVMLGSAINIRLFTNMLPPLPALAAYRDRLEARPAWKRAADLTWPASLFPRS